MARLPRGVSFLPGPFAAGWGWGTLGQPAGGAGLTTAMIAGLFLWPLAVTAVVFGLPAVLMRLSCPRSWRRKWRNRDPGWFILLLHWVTGAPVGRDGARSAYIPKWLERAVKAADGWCCVFCGSDVAIQVDHVGPWSLGFLTTLWNLMTLCGTCNRAKSNAWFNRDGTVWPGRSSRPRRAEEILLAELRHRHNPARWYRAAWQLGA
jgi:hypothetical protein